MFTPFGQSVEDITRQHSRPLGAELPATNVCVAGDELPAGERTLVLRFCRVVFVRGERRRAGFVGGVRRLNARQISAAVAQLTFDAMAALGRMAYSR